ncbi:MAG: hypothetical protein R2705_08790 [Ilumatobacteraceae bacterium]
MSRPTSRALVPISVEQPDPVTVRVLPARCGDCLVVEMGPSGARRRFLVDGGLKSIYDEGLGAYLTSDASPPHFDLAVVTHIDRDHIDGVIEALAAGVLDADDIWFNGRDEIEVLLSGDDAGDRGYRQGDELSRLLPAELRNRAVGGSAVHVPDAGPPEYDVAGARITLLSPVRRRLERLVDRWPVDAGSDPAATEALIDAFEDPGSRGEGEFGEDGSVANGSSIAFLLEVDGVSLLLTGDAFAPDLEVAIRTLLERRGEPRLAVDLFKLSHHGSRQNLTDSLLDLIEPSVVLVCTDGSKFRHPDEDAIVKVREHYPEASIRFSDDDGTNAHIRARAELVGSVANPPGPLLLTFTSSSAPTSGPGSGPAPSPPSGRASGGG